jgi:predicted RNA-binding protein YlqC (UPF0109 family)
MYSTRNQKNTDSLREHLVPNDDNLRFETSPDHKNGQYIIKVMMRDMDQMVAKQAEQYLKGLIANALKTAVMMAFPSIQKRVDDFIMSDATRQFIESELRDELKKVVDEHVKDMFG